MAKTAHCISLASKRQSTPFIHNCIEGLSHVLDTMQTHRQKIWSLSSRSSQSNIAQKVICMKEWRTVNEDQEIRALRSERDRPQTATP